MANVIGVRGTGPRNWNKGNSENETKKQNVHENTFVA